MKKSRIKRREVLSLSMIGFFISALSVFLLPFSESNNEEPLSVVGVAIGLLFWAGLFIGISLFFMTWVSVKKDERYIRLKENVRPGYLSFCSNKWAKINDIVFCLAVIIVAISVTVPTLPDILILLGLFFAIYNFCLHFILNGRVYKFLFNIEKGRKIARCTKG